MNITNLILTENFADARKSIFDSLDSKKNLFRESKHLQLVSEIYGSKESSEEELNEGLIDKIQDVKHRMMRRKLLNHGWVPENSINGGISPRKNNAYIHPHIAGHTIYLNKPGEKDEDKHVYWNHQNGSGVIGAGHNYTTLKKHLKNVHDQYFNPDTTSEPITEDTEKKNSKNELEERFYGTAKTKVCENCKDPLTSENKAEYGHGIYIKREGAKSGPTFDYAQLCKTCHNTLKKQGIKQIHEGFSDLFKKKDKSLHSVALRKGWIATEASGALTHPEKPDHFLFLKKAENGEQYWNHQIKVDDDKPFPGAHKIVKSGKGHESLKDHLEDFHGTARSLKESSTPEYETPGDYELDDKERNARINPEYHSSFDPEYSLYGKVRKIKGKYGGEDYLFQHKDGKTTRVSPKHFSFLNESFLKLSNLPKPGKEYHDLAKEFGYKQEGPGQSHMGILEYKFSHPNGSSLNIKVPTNSDKGATFIHGFGATQYTGAGLMQLKNVLETAHKVDTKFSQDDAKTKHMKGECDGYPCCDFCTDPDEDLNSYVKEFNGR